MDKYDLVKDLKEGGVFLLNCQWGEEELERNIPGSMKKALAEKKARFYIIDAIKIARKLGLGGRTNTVLQSAFFKLVDIIPIKEAVAHMKEAVRKTYEKKGQNVVDMNCAAIEEGIESLVKVHIPESWARAQVEKKDTSNLPEFIRDVVIPVSRQEGDSLPVSMYKNIPGGTWPSGTTAYEKRGTAVDVPEWNMDKCIQCNQCSYVCPHAAIRPFLMDEEEMQKAPLRFAVLKAVGKGLENYKYRMQISPYDCTGCGSCANICPAKRKSIGNEAACNTAA